MSEEWIARATGGFGLHQTKVNAVQFDFRPTGTGFLVRDGEAEGFGVKFDRPVEVGDFDHDVGDALNHNFLSRVMGTYWLGF